MKNYYAILEVSAGAGLEEIRQAYHRLTQEHLDDDDAFADLKEALEVLTSPARREAYDRTLIGEAAISSVARRAPAVRCPLQAGAQCPVLNAQVTAADMFCPECGYLLSALSDGGAAFEGSFSTDPSSMARLEGGDGQVHFLQTGLNVIGRESADVLLTDKTVSRRHARLELGSNGMVTLEDLGSTNGTQINDVLLVPPVQRRVADGDRLRFGSVMTVLHLPVFEAALTQSSLPAEIPVSEIPMTQMPQNEMPQFPPVPPAQVVDIRAEFGQIYPLLPGVTTFGRRPENTVVLSGDQYVSGSHARIAFETNQYVLTDTGSTNGTLLNGDRLAVNAPALLTHGDVILIGGAALRFEIIGMPLDDEVKEELDEELDMEELNDEESDGDETVRTSSTSAV